MNSRPRWFHWWIVYNKYLRKKWNNLTQICPENRKRGTNQVPHCRAQVLQWDQHNINTRSWQRHYKKENYKLIYFINIDTNIPNKILAKWIDNTQVGKITAKLNSLKNARLKINGIQHIYRLKVKSHIFILINIKKAFAEIWHPFFLL